MKIEETECSETSAYKIQTPGNYPAESIKHSEYGESLKSRIYHFITHKPIVILDPSEGYVLLKVFQPLNR